MSKKVCLLPTQNILSAILKLYYGINGKIFPKLGANSVGKKTNKQKTGMITMSFFFLLSVHIHNLCDRNNNTFVYMDVFPELTLSIMH